MNLLPIVYSLLIRYRIFVVSVFIMVQEIVGISKYRTAKNDMQVSTKQYVVCALLQLSYFWSVDSLSAVSLEVHILFSWLDSAVLPPS